MDMPACGVTCWVEAVAGEVADVATGWCWVCSASVCAEAANTQPVTITPTSMGIHLDITISFHERTQAKAPGNSMVVIDSLGGLSEPPSHEDTAKKGSGSAT
jgi:hypothetical protein